MLSSAMADLPAWLRVVLVMASCVATFIVVTWLTCFIISKGDNPGKENDDEQ